MRFLAIDDGVLTRRFTEHLTSRIIAMLKRVQDLVVIDAESTFALRRNINPASVGNLLGVDYVLTGQLIRSEGEVTCAQRLNDAHTGELVLSVDIPFAMDQLFEFDRNVLTRVVADILAPLRESEIDRIVDQLPRLDTAYELTVRAEIILHELTLRNVERARKLLTKAIAINPRHASAYALLARNHSIRVGQGWTKDRLGESQLALDRADEAVAIDPENALALAISGHVNSYLHKRYDVGLDRLNCAVKASPSEPVAHGFLAATLSYMGDGAEARRHGEFALSLSPLSSQLYTFLLFTAVGCWVQGDYEAAEAYAREALELNPNYSSTYKVLMAVLVARGKVAEARGLNPRLHELEPQYSLRVAQRTTPFRAPEQRQQFLRQLQTAGAFGPVPRQPAAPRAPKHLVKA